MMCSSWRPPECWPKRPCKTRRHSTRDSILSLRACLTGPRSILLPDEDGHYASEAKRLDRESHRIVPSGGHELDPIARHMAIEETRRRFFSRTAQGIGALALASLMPREAHAAEAIGGLPGLPHFAPKAKRC